MQEVQALLLTLNPEGVWGKTAFVSLCWFVAACLGHFVTAALMLRRFSREGPVIPLLLPGLEEKWSRAAFRIEIWVWLRRIGFAGIFLALFLAAGAAGMYAYSVLGEQLAPLDWRAEAALRAQPMIGIVQVLGIALAVRVVIGGAASLLLARARNYVSASSALVSSEDLSRARRYLDGLQQYDSEESPGDKD